MKNNKETRMQFRIESKIKKDYISFCKKQKIMYSKRVRQLIIDDMNTSKKVA